MTDAGAHDEAEELERARAVYVKARDALLQGSHEEALAGFEAVLPVLERLGTEIEAAHCHENRSFTLSRLGHHGEGLADFGAALAVYERLGEEIEAADCHNLHAWVRPVGL